MGPGVDGRPCETCYGEGHIPTDAGPARCPDCGGAGALPTPDTHIEWRLREVERAFGAGVTELAEGVRWLVFEVRRARGALTEIIAASEDIEETAERVRIRALANRALGLYDEIADRTTKGSRS